MLDIFTGITCYSLQNHLRTSVTGIGQTETDEVYVGVDRSGTHYVLPVQAKGGRDRLRLVQIAADVAMCGERFPNLVCRPIAAQFIDASTIALMAFREEVDNSIVKVMERHFRLVSPAEISDEELALYRVQTENLD